MLKFDYYSRYDDDELRVLNQLTKAGYNMDLEAYLSYVLKQVLLMNGKHDYKLKGLTENKVREVREIMRKNRFYWRNFNVTKLYKHEINLNINMTLKELMSLNATMSRNFFGINYIFDFALAQLINLNIYDYKIPYSKAESSSVRYEIVSLKLDKTKHKYALKFREAMKHENEIRKD